MPRIAVEFVPYDTANPEQMEQLKKVTALIREKHVPVANLDVYKPGQVVEKVAARIPFPFNTALHTRAWRHYGVRPASQAGQA